MDANLSLMTTPTGNALQTGALSSNSATKGTLGKVMSGEDFANLMRSLLPTDQRQGLAASNTPTSAAGLKTHQLGSQFDLVTTEAPLPDDNSLAAFAKSQGLTDGAVQALFGEIQPLTLKSLMTPSGTDAKALKLTDATQPKESGVNPFLTGIDLQNTPPLWFNAVANPPNGLALDPKGTADGLMGIAASAQTSPSSWMGMPNASTQAAATNPMSTGMDLSASGFELDPTQLALSQVLSQHGAQLKVGSMGAPDTSHSPIDALAADASQTDSINLNAMRMSLIPAWENVTRQLANASGLQAQKWANLINGWSPSSKNGVAESFIDLGNTSAGDPIDTGDGMGKVSATFNNDNNIQLPNGTHQAPSLNLNGQVSTQDTAATSSTDSATQIAQMTDKLSQALSERLQTQIEQGQWKLELKLKPANLGKISVELDMNSGGLDAVFKTDNPMTRDLLVQSTQKLRDNLEQAGMTVANVWVNQNNQQGTGGNSTPWQQAPQNTVVESSGPTPQPTQNMSNIAKSADGWDQLV